MLVLYSKKYKFVFIVHSRCWSKTLMNFMIKLNNININTVSHKIISSMKEICLNNVSDIKKYIDFSYEVYIFVRNPYERIIMEIKAHNLFKENTFSEIINYNIKKFNYLKLSHTLTIFFISNFKYKNIFFPDIKKFLDKFISEKKIQIKIEGTKEFTHLKNIPYKWKENEIYNIKMKEFISYEIPEYKYFYNQELINIVYNEFREDFINFNFSENIDSLKPKI